MRRLVLTLALTCAGAAGAEPPAALLDRMTGGALPLHDAAPPVPGAEGSEQWLGEDMVGLAVRNVTEPTLLPVLPPPGRGNGAGVIVVPGGGFVAVALGNEGVAVAERLAERGIAAFVLKYRTEPTPRDLPGFGLRVERGIRDFLATGSEGAFEGEEAALADAQRALRLVRERAGDWGVDPERLGFLGFSAGAMTALNAVLADAPGARPAFAGLIYGRMAAVTPPPAAPPVFVALAADDPLFGAAGFGLVESWRAAGAPVELHLFERGGHGFGMAPRGLTSDRWFDLFLGWLAMHGMIPAEP